MPVTTPLVERIAAIGETTPGPWERARNLPLVHHWKQGPGDETGNVLVAECGNYRDKELLPFNGERWLADAALIALAPEMRDYITDLEARLAALRPTEAGDASERATHADPRLDRAVEALEDLALVLDDGADALEMFEPGAAKVLREEVQRARQVLSTIQGE